jgi:uncharacterized membrane protein
MTVIYARIRLSPFELLKSAVATGEWPAAAAQLDRLRKLVSINLVLGIVTIGVAIVGRLL